MVELDDGDRILFRSIMDVNDTVGIVREKKVNKMLNIVPDSFGVATNPFNTKNGSINVHQSMLKKYKVLVKHESVKIKEKWYKRILK